MYQEERIYKILEILKTKKTMTNQEIMDQFHISRDTARRDIVRLVSENLAVRTHGGITLNDNKISDTNYVLSDSDFKDGFAILKKGKKSYYKLQKNN